MKQYSHILLSNSSGKRLDLVDAPRGWSAQKFNLVRDFIYFGVLKSISVEFEFLGAAFDMLQYERLVYGVDADILIRIYRKKKFLFEGKINFQSYVEDRKFNLFKVDVIQSANVQDFNNREDVELNIFNNISLDRLPISPAEKKLAHFKGKRILYYSQYNGVNTTEEIKYHHTTPFKMSVNGNPGVQEIYNVWPDTWIWEFDADPLTDVNPLIDVGNAIYTNVISEPQTIQLKFGYDALLKYVGPTYTSDNIQLFVDLKVLQVNADNTIAARLQYARVPINMKINGSINARIDFDQSIVVQPGQYLIFLYELWFKPLLGVLRPMDLEEMDGTIKTVVEYSNMSLIISQDSVVTDSQHDVVLPFELFTNLAQQINGWAFESAFFGRTDTGYAVNGKGALVGITKGELLRGIDPSKVQIATSWRTAFQSYHSLFCLGAIIKANGIQVEPLDDLFNHILVEDIGEVSNLLIKPATDYLFNSVKAGFPANEYEQENGRDEFNTEVQYTNSLRAVKKELDIRSKFCGDGYGIEFARRASIVSTGTQDSRYDDKIFFVCLKYDEYTGDLVTKTTEDVLSVSGIFSPETALNLDIAPGQNILRHSRYLNIPLHRKSKQYYFQSKDKNASLNLVTYLGTTIDGQDISTGTRAYFLPQERNFDAPFTMDMLASIINNPLGIIKYSHKKEKFFDIIYEVDAETDKGVAEWRMLAMRDTPQQVIAEDVLENYLKWSIADGNYIKYNRGLGNYIKYKK